MHVHVLWLSYNSVLGQLPLYRDVNKLNLLTRNCINLLQSMCFHFVRKPQNINSITFKSTLRLTLACTRKKNT